MIGQGGPTPLLGRFGIFRTVLLVGLAVMTWTSTVAAETLTLRIDWGGNRPIRYRGNISLSEGRIEHIRPLGVEADEPGSIWIDKNRVWIAPIGPRVYDGIDLRMNAPIHSAKLRVELGLDPRSPSTSVVEVPLSKLLNESVSSSLDKQGTRVLLRRAPGDVFRVDFKKRPLIFNGQEDFLFELTPHLLPPTSGRCQIVVRLCRADDSNTIKKIATIDLGQQERPIPIRVPLLQNDGVTEGVYDVVIDLVHFPSLKLPQVGDVPVGRKKTLMSRKIQLLVLDPSRPNLWGNDSGSVKVIEEIDPANPSRWDQFTRPPQALAKFQLNLPGLKVTSIESGDLKTVNHKLGKMAQLAPNHDGHASWEAYVLTVRKPGKPHILELEYPSDVPQALAVSVMEPNATGALTPIQFDSGLLRTKDRLDLSQDNPKILKHRVIFWPKTTSPIILLANQSDIRPAVHGKLRLSAGWEHLPPAACPTYLKSGRLFASYFDQPIFYQSFGAKEVYDPWGKRSLDDWNTYYQGGSRLIEYLKYTGANGVMMSVASDGGAIYPSRVLQPTPRFEKGIFFASGQDPVRKDVLEMLLTMCDRAQVRMIPAIRFNASLPKLEERLRKNRSVSEKMGIHLLGPGGKFWSAEDAAPTAKLMGNRMPIYNILDPRVQDAVFEATVELLDRYAASHDSLAGVALQMSYDSFLQLPGPEWGIDDVTIARFEKETGIQVDMKKDAKNGDQIDRFTRRARILCRKHRAAWLAWRAKQLHQFHIRLHREIATRTRGGNLYLTGANLVIGPMWQRRLRGAPGAQFTIRQALLEVGIDPYYYQPTDGPILVCPERIGTFKWSNDKVASIEMTRMLDTTGPVENSPLRASMFYHVPSVLRAKSFDEKGLARVSFTRLESQLVPSGLQNRRRFAHRLAMFDTRVFFDGGRLLPMGQESSIQDLVATYRGLPDVSFQSWVPRGKTQSIQPVVIRFAEYRGRRYYYLVNDSQFPVGITLDFQSSKPIRLERVGQKNVYEKIQRTGQTTTWSPTLRPYDLIAVCVDTSKNELVRAHVKVPSEVQKRIASRIMELGLRAAALRKPASMDVLSNPSFEKEVVSGASKTILPLADKDDYRIPGWKIHTVPGTQVRIDSTIKDPPNSQKPPGQQCVHLKSDGGMVAISSETFESPQTGRLWIELSVRIPDEKKQPTFEIILTGKHKGHDFVKMAVLGQQRNGQIAPKLLAGWRTYYLPVNDLPFEGLENASIGFRLVGKGEVWIDDVQMKHLAGFHDQDVKQLSQIVSIAEMKLQSNRISECLRLLEGLWPQYLERNVSVPAILAEQPRRTPRRRKEPETSAGMFDRVKNIFR